MLSGTLITCRYTKNSLEPLFFWSSINKIHELASILMPHKRVDTHLNVIHITVKSTSASSLSLSAPLLLRLLRLTLSIEQKFNANQNGATRTMLDGN